MGTKTILTFYNDKVYHLMCRTLPELQALRPLGEPWEEGDWIFSDEGDVRCVEYPYPRRGLLKSLRDEGESWLTRPDQLGVIFNPDDPWALREKIECWRRWRIYSEPPAPTPWQFELNILAQEKWHKWWNREEWVRV